MQYFKGKLYTTSVKRKIIAGFLLVFIAILLALGITRFGFREMMETVDQLSTPNKQLNALNNIFQEITTLDQQQRAEAIKNPRNPYKAFLNQSKSLVNKIDSLRMMEWDSAQQTRLFEIKEILQKRNQLFFSYLKLKSELIDNRSLSGRLDTLSSMLVNERIIYDTSVVTTEKKTTTTSSKDSVTNTDERSRLGKLFGRKKKVTPQTTNITVREEFSVIIDTFSVARQNKALEEVEKIIVDLENDQRAENRKLLNEELELIHANSLLINELLGILHEVENEELAQLNRNNDHAVSLVTQSISRITILLIVFFIGAAILVYLIWIDISRSNYYKEQLEKAKDEAEELTQVKQRFLANMSHEIRTPLQSIIGFAEQLKQQDDGDPEAVKAIHSSSEHLLHIVNEVLDFSRISSGSFALTTERFNLLSLITEIESALRVQAEKKGLSLLVDHEHATEYNLYGDPFRLRQVLYNLLGNAIKFTTKGYAKIAITTTDENRKVNCTFEISDTGIGIQEEDVDKIFNQFEQANALITRQFGGTGLGLSIVKSLVAAQGGALDVSSEPGRGSTFTVKLIFEKASDDKTETSVNEAEPTVSFEGKVIVVDDDLMILRLCSLILKKNGLPFITYNDALKLIDEEPDPAVTHVLMDIRMPEINGIELCHALRKSYPEKTKFVALTAHVLPTEQQQLLKEGFDIVLSKPFREQELLQVFGITVSENNNNDSETLKIDLKSLRAMTMGDEALLQSILGQFIEETENDLEALDELLKNLRPEPIREIVHKLSGRLGQMGVLALSSKLRTIEMSLADGTPASDLVDELQEAREEVDRLLKTTRDLAVANPIV